MKRITTLLLAAIAAAFINATPARAAVSVDFSGGGGAPLSVTLPEMSWEITNAASFNGSGVFGVGIAVGQPPASTQLGLSQGAMLADWSATGSLVITGTPAFNFYLNNAFGGANNGGIIAVWLSSNILAVNGDVISFTGGTLSSTDSTLATFSDDLYETYIISGQSGQAVSASGVAVPEPSQWAALVGALALAAAFIRSRKRELLGRDQTPARRDPTRTRSATEEAPAA